LAKIDYFGELAAILAKMRVFWSIGINFSKKILFWQQLWHKELAILALRDVPSKEIINHHFCMI
jgi:hypothetical protein